MSYPEHDKLQAVQEKSQAIGEFLEWLQSHKHLRICKAYSGKKKSVMKKDPVVSVSWHPCSFDINSLLAEFFGIDLRKLEAEKSAMLDYLRSMQDSDKP